LERTVDLARIDLLLDDLGALSVNLAADGEGSAEDLLDGALQGLGERLVAHGPSNVDDLIKRNRLAVLDVLLLLAVTWGLLQRTDDKRGGSRDDGDGGLTVLDGELDRDTEALLYFENIFGQLRRAFKSPPEPDSGRPRDGVLRSKHDGSYPVTSSLGDIFTNFLGRKTQGTNLGREGGRGTDLTSGGTEVAVFPSRQLRLAHRSQFEIARSNRCCDGVGEGGQVCVHDLHLIGVELGSCVPNDCQYSDRDRIQRGIAAVYSRILTGG
jgi:hypothetical protein